MRCGEMQIWSRSRILNVPASRPAVRSVAKPHSHSTPDRCPGQALETPRDERMRNQAGYGSSRLTWRLAQNLVARSRSSPASGIRRRSMSTAAGLAASDSSVSSAGFCRSERIGCIGEWVWFCCRMRCLPVRVRTQTGAYPAYVLNRRLLQIVIIPRHQACHSELETCHPAKPSAASAARQAANRGISPDCTVACKDLESLPVRRQAECGNTSDLH